MDCDGPGIIFSLQGKGFKRSATERGGQILQKSKPLIRLRTTSKN
jgi:hypothetical protein